MSAPPPLSEVTLIGRSAAVRDIETQISRAAGSDGGVLIRGETGVGKELVARLVHARSARASGPIATVNCAGLPDRLLESELFGHVRGSFFGAYADKRGQLEAAANGTLFLDEIGEMRPAVQVALERFVESGEIRRVGAPAASVCVNVRLTAGTNRDLLPLVASGAFSRRLHARLTMSVSIPPLRERLEDIPALVEYFLRAYGRGHDASALALSSATWEALVAYRWPGNVRELRNVVERIVLKSHGLFVEPDSLPKHISGNGHCPREAAVLAATP